MNVRHICNLSRRELIMNIFKHYEGRKKKITHRLSRAEGSRFLPWTTIVDKTTTPPRCTPRGALTLSRPGWLVAVGVPRTPDVRPRRAGETRVPSYRARRTCKRSRCRHAVDGSIARADDHGPPRHVHRVRRRRRHDRLANVVR